MSKLLSKLLKNHSYLIICNLMGGSKLKEEDEQLTIFSKLGVIGILIYNGFWLVIISIFLLLNLKDKSSSFLEGWNSLISFACLSAIILCSIYLYTKNEFIMITKLILRTCMTVVLFVALICQFFVKYQKGIAHAIQFLDLAFCICEFAYICFAIDSIDTYYNEYVRISEKKKKSPSRNSRHNNYYSIL